MMKIQILREAFVGGMTEIIDQLVKCELHTNVDDGFVLHFSANPFPGYQAKLTWFEKEFGGNWYNWKSMCMSGWLCPALFCYFDVAPKEIYVQAKIKR